MSFLHKRIGTGPSTFGADLRDLRELHNFTIEQVARETKIRDTVLRALEEDRLIELDDPAFMERHLQTYVRHLGGYEPYFLARYRAKLEELHATRKTSDLLPRLRGVGRFDLIVGPHVLGVIGVIVLAVGLGGYVWWQAQAVNASPPLVVDAPVDGERLTHPTVIVRGHTIPEAYVRVNGRDAAVDGTGAFSLTLDVRRGTMIVNITARRRRGSETIVERRVVYDRPLPDAALMDLSVTSSPSE